MPLSIQGASEGSDPAMSQANTPMDHGTALPENGTALFGRVLRAVLAPIEAAFFWAAIVLPFLHLPLLVSGLDSQSAVLAFVGLLGLNVVSVVIGHRHGRDDAAN